MKRRCFAISAIVASVWPLAGWGEPRVIGFLSYGNRDNFAPRLKIFHEAMKARGYVEGRDYVLHTRYSETDDERLPSLAAELLRLNPQIVLASASVSIRALKNQTSTVPIVSVGTGDPVGAGFAQTLARPGGNFTGVSNMNVDTTGKLLEYLRRVVPGATRIGLFVDSHSASVASHRRNARDAAQRLGIQVSEFEAARPEEIDGLFARMREQAIRGVLVAGTAFTISHAKRIAAAAIRVRLPAISQNASLADEGLLLAYGADREVNYRLAADYVDRILRGAKPGDLPIVQPTEFALTINQRTARALGISIPRDLLLEAPRLVE